MVFLPENFHYLGTHFSQSLALAEPIEGPEARSIGRYRELARDCRVWLSLGGFQEKSPDPSRVRNCHVIVDDGGNIRAAYRKIHLFDVDVPGGATFRESGFTEPGSAAVVVPDSPIGTLGLSTCYDLRFPELYQHLAHDLGADVLLVPAAFTRPTGEAHWDALLRARAIETESYVIAAAQAGVHNEKRASWGHARVFAPWGELVATPEDPDAPGIAVAEIDLDQVRRVRERMPVAKHRKEARERRWWENSNA